MAVSDPQQTTQPRPSGSERDEEPPERTDTIRTVGVFKLRGPTDDLPRSWWFAGTAVPLLAATQGPLSNVLSIASLVTAWRVRLADDGQLPAGAEDSGNGVRLPDPKWELALNGVSLACGFAGNLLLLLHFVGRVRYIVALPASIVFWLLASGILVAVTASVAIHIPAVPPGETYTQGYWHAVLASITYMFGALMLVANLTGYLLGHYPQNFVLDDDQRTLILQTMMFFIWLAGGAAIFSTLEGWSFADSLYYCDVSVLTIGYGDLAPATTAGRGFFFAYELIGITQLGLVISRISRYMSNISADKVIKKHQHRARENTLGRTVTDENELRERLGLPQKPATSVGQRLARRDTLSEIGRFQVVGNTVTFRTHVNTASGDHSREKGQDSSARPAPERSLSLSIGQVAKKIRRDQGQRLLILKGERDRFNAMREIQDDTRRFKRYYTLAAALLTFSTLWCLGALVFLYAEDRTQDMNYFDSFYFCFVTLLTVGYGDISPQSNIAKPFFIVWSLIAVPSITVLIQALSDTVVDGVNRVTNILLPEKGFIQSFVDSNPNHWLSRLIQGRDAQKRVSVGFQVQDPDEADAAGEGGDAHSIQDSSTVEDRDAVFPASRSGADGLDEHVLARQLAAAIRHVARDLQADPPKRYSYEEWLHFKKLIRFSTGVRKEDVQSFEEEGDIVQWDWIGDDSPMLADATESEWILDRLCESLNRYTERNSQRVGKLSLLHTSLF
ncbi:hypothetical protein GGR56DRAFT_663257 [Xylariaceae sp. FL0804]|nr:hypothetical protein GGR56DRAFT_663257 [Xylariaceae sp. FL0804]